MIDWEFLTLKPVQTLQHDFTELDKNNFLQLKVTFLNNIYILNCIL